MRASTRSTSLGYKTCIFCGRWPACLYVRMNEKHGDRCCEFCVEEGRIVQGEDGTYITNPEAPAEEAESPESHSHSSSADEDGTDSAA